MNILTEAFWFNICQLTKKGREKDCLTHSTYTWTLQKVVKFLCNLMSLYIRCDNLLFQSNKAEEQQSNMLNINQESKNIYFKILRSNMWPNREGKADYIIQLRKTERRNVLLIWLLSLIWLNLTIEFIVLKLGTKIRRKNIYFFPTFISWVLLE